MHKKCYYPQNEGLSKGVGAIYRDKTYLQEEGLSQADIISRGGGQSVLQGEERATRTCLAIGRGTFYRDKDHLLREGLFIERSNMCKRERMCPRKDCETVQRDRGFLQEKALFTTGRGTVYRIRNNPQEQRVSARRVFKERRAIYIKRDQLEGEGLSTMRGNVYKKGTTHRKRKHALLHLPEVTR